MVYKYSTIEAKEAYFIGSYVSLLDPGEPISFYIPSECQDIKRKVFDGFITYIGKISGYDVGIIFNDFRSLGSSFGQDNSRRVIAFIEELDQKKIPLIYLCQSMGIRIQEGRSLFKDTFSLIPVIKKFATNNTYLALSLGQTLGLGAILYSLADYRIALADKSTFNLTGPDVFKMFLGEKVSFSQFCSAERMCQYNQLVHEVSASPEEAFAKLRSLITLEASISLEESSLKEQCCYLIEEGIHLFESFGKSVKVRIFSHGDKRIGVLLNPYLRPNLISYLDIKKLRMALKLFKKLDLPLVHIVDTPGADPRISENDLNIAGEIYNLASDLIDYPRQKRAFIVGRCFGGASILSLPVFFGGEKTVVVCGAKMGIMDKGIIRTLLKNSGPLLKQWEEAALLETDEYKDFIDDGLLEEVIDPETLIKSLFHFVD